MDELDTGKLRALGDILRRDDSAWICTAGNEVHAAADTIDTLRQQLAEARALWAQMAFPRGPEHAGELADAMDKLLASGDSHD